MANEDRRNIMVTRNGGAEADLSSQLPFAVVVISFIMDGRWDICWFSNKSGFGINYGWMCISGIFNLRDPRTPSYDS